MVNPLTAADFAGTAALVGDTARAQMLMALMDGRALTASELAYCANITPQTASGHLSRLTAAGLLVMERQGRHRYHRLASSAVAHMLESIMSVASQNDWKVAKRPVIAGPRDRALRQLRSCYDHLAGEIAVALADRLVERELINLSGDGGIVTENGTRFFRGIGMDIDAICARANLKGGGRVFCRPCLDWSERRPHIAGAVGAALATTCFAKGWFRRAGHTRVVSVTTAGRAALKKTFDMHVRSPS